MRFSCMALQLLPMRQITSMQETQHFGLESSKPDEQNWVAGLGSADTTECAGLPETAAPEGQDVGLRGNGEARNQDGIIPEEAPAWRDEVAERLNRYRSRRKPPPPRYPSLSLRFEPEQSPRELSLLSDDSFPADAPTLEKRSDCEVVRGATAVKPTSPDAEQAASPFVQTGRPAYSRAKIIEFPRSAASDPPRAPLDELAEPVIEHPRILEAPEIVPAPALGGITIDTEARKEIEKQPGIDYPLQSAPLARRIIAATLDWMIIAAASVLFAFIFWKIAAVQPPRFQMLGLVFGIPCLLWAAYQYLFIVYSGSTPGLRLAGLDVASFDGSRPNRRRRRWRVLASYLSATSLGMGYAWLFLDEDALCWHDRITHTYLAPKSVNRESRPTQQKTD